jgi:hypothetical protein
MFDPLISCACGKGHANSERVQDKLQPYVALLSCVNAFRCMHGFVVSVPVNSVEREQINVVKAKKPKGGL